MSDSGQTRVLAETELADLAAERRLLSLLESLNGLTEAECEAAIAKAALPEATRQRLEKLLQWQQETGQTHEALIRAATPTLPDVGSHVDVYRIERFIGEGGMGVVYQAQRDDGIYEQKVAIKLLQPSRLRPGARLRKRMLARFDEERAILAQLQHPNIVRIIDGGTTDQGIPYLVMEFIDGVDLMSACHLRRLPVVARLQLFCQVCDAVQEAHRHLIVHRDLKPGNVLVDAQGQPHLLDFGIAKLVDPLHDSGADHKSTVLHAMTPAYASPEQVRRQTITTHSDIYSLGVMLYELLSGRRPFSDSEGSAADIERAICELEPPSLTRALQMDDSDAGYAQRPGRFSQDLERIVAKAMHKEPARRYGTAQELAEDLRRHLSGRPVLARPDTLWYRSRKFLGRHRVASTIAAVGLCLILAASGVAVHQGYKAHRLAIESAEINRFLLETLNQTNVDVTGEEVRLGDVLEAATGGIDRHFGDRPWIAAGVRHAIAGSLLNLDRLGAAETQILTGLSEARKAFGGSDPVTHQLTGLLASLRHAQGHLDEARQIYGELIDRLEADGKTATHAYVTAQNDLGTLHLTESDYAKARAHIATALDAVERRGVDVPRDEYANILTNLAHVHHGLEDYEPADRYYARATEIYAQLRPEGSRDASILLNNRALLAWDRQLPDKALALMGEAVEMRRKVYRGDHPVVAFGLTNLARMALLSGQMEIAENAALDAVAMVDRLPGERGETWVRAHLSAVQVLLHQGRRAEAEAALEPVDTLLAENTELPSRTRELADHVRQSVQAAASAAD